MKRIRHPGGVFMILIKSPSRTRQSEGLATRLPTPEAAGNGGQVRADFPL